MPIKIYSYKKVNYQKCDKDKKSCCSSKKAEAKS